MHKTINIILPYEHSRMYAEQWAESEREIDFENNAFEAARCTVSFAATEIKNHLSKIGVFSLICDDNEKKESFSVFLELTDDASGEEGYSLIPVTDGIKIHGKGRAGVLYGAYEFLKLQGFRWYAPGATGNVVPKALTELKMPKERLNFAPDMDEGRGFDFENHSIETIHTWLWMARNRLNVGAYSFKHAALQKKLCIKFKVGGHIFEKMLAPKKMTASGETNWEAHRDWYGVRDDGVEVTESNCLRTQFCVSNDELVDYLSGELMGRFEDDWKFADRADIWGFDTWGNVCRCEKCKKLGNASDITLAFMSKLRETLNSKPYGKRIRLITCAYDGTATMSPPKNTIPQNLIDAKDMVVFYPITRCYRHNFNDNECKTNKRFNDDLLGWLSLKPAMPVIIGEYYNVSKFEDLPIMFTRTIENDVPYYHSVGARGITYMHFPLLNMGMRALTHLLYAELSWNTKTDTNAVKADYFKNYYGAFSEEMEKLYSLAENAFEMCTQWRAWGLESVLAQLLFWDCGIPSKPIAADIHLKTHGEIIESGEKSCKLLDMCLEIINEINKKELDALKGSLLSPVEIMNPVDREKHAEKSNMSRRISEDKRFLTYALDTMLIMTEVMKLYDALYTGKKDLSRNVLELERLYYKMDSYYIPLASNALVNDTVCKSAFERSQLEDIVKKCIAVYK